METRGPTQHSPAAERNRQPILQMLQQLLPARGQALEIASGTGQHAAYFGSGLPHWTWQPSDAVSDAFGSIASWCAQAGATNVAEPLVLDVLAPRWPSVGAEFTRPFDAIFCANMLHIAPWATCAALMGGASRYLAPEGRLITYGPYFEHGAPASAGNLNFDKSLRDRNPQWGIRWLQDVVHQAALAGLQFNRREPMPANNLLLVFQQPRPADHYGAAVTASASISTR